MNFVLQVKLHNLHISTNVTTVKKSFGIRSAGHIAYTEDASTFLVDKSERKGLLGNLDDRGY
jgi:hypothetical protein